MFNPNFYPTPPMVAAQLTAGIEKYNTKILEPSAGKGDLLKSITETKSYNYQSNIENIYCIEIEPDLQAILKSKGYKVVYNDFLTYKPDLLFDYIIMNPPFDTGAKHLLKAIEISRGAEIRCLLNKETISNISTKERQVLLNYLTENNAEIQELGQVFKNSERPTNVEVVSIKLKTNGKEKIFDFEPGRGQEKTYRFDDIPQDQIIRADALAALEERFDRTVDAFARLIKARNEINYYTNGVFYGERNNYGDGLKDLITKNYESDDKAYFNKLVEEFRAKAWNTVFNKTKFAEYVTHQVKEDFEKHRNDCGFIPFTAENIENVFTEIFMNRGNIMNNCIVEAFDYMTAYHKENRIHIEGWKTNDAWRVNRKVILPNVCSSYRWDYKSVDLDWSKGDKLNDIDKALCFIDGRKYDEIETIYQYCKERKPKYGELCRSTFWDFRVYKKGTIHMEFKNPKLWEQFNLIACKNKNWLPAGKEQSMF
jgi:hypothetical protein